MLEKLKSLLEDQAFYISALIIFVAVASFGLGRLSVKNENMAQNKPSGIEFLVPAGGNKKSVDEPESTEKFLVASKSGARYHLLSCPGASQIKESNKIFFSSFLDAEAAGFTPAANCQF